jgi:hypothetical protein
MASDISIKHPYTCIIEEPTRSGMSTFCIRFLQDLDILCTEPDLPIGIIWCYIEQSARAPTSINRVKGKRADSQGST